MRPRGNAAMDDYGVSPGSELRQSRHAVLMEVGRPSPRPATIGPSSEVTVELPVSATPPWQGSWQCATDLDV